MEGLDHAITELGGGSVALALLAAFLLGLRHATDPDHLTAVSTLVLGDAARSASALGLRHAHPHVHEHGAGEEHGEAHHHAHAEELGRTPAAAYGIGLAHGVGGSAGVGILLVGGVSGGAAAAAALVLFAAATAASMALVSSVFGAALARGPLLRRFEQLVPVLGTFSLLFGVWYGLGAAGYVA